MSKLNQFPARYADTHFFAQLPTFQTFFLFFQMTLINPPTVYFNKTQGKKFYDQH